MIPAWGASCAGRFSRGRIPAASSTSRASRSTSQTPLEELGGPRALQRLAAGGPRRCAGNRRARHQYAHRQYPARGPFPGLADARRPRPHPPDPPRDRVYALLAPDAELQSAHFACRLDAGGARELVGLQLPERPHPRRRRGDRPAPERLARRTSAHQDARRDRRRAPAELHRPTGDRPGAPGVDHLRRRRGPDHQPAHNRRPPLLGRRARRLRDRRPTAAARVRRPRPTGRALQLPPPAWTRGTTNPPPYPWPS